jgi:hypothetical protein
MANDYTNFNQFWPYYVCEHSRPLTRWLHFCGTLLLLSVILLAVLASPWYLLLLPVVGYGFAWTSHAFVERNKPATYPLWPLLADFKMFFYICTGKMAAEVKRCTGEAEQKGA